MKITDWLISATIKQSDRIPVPSSSSPSSSVKMSSPNKDAAKLSPGGVKSVKSAKLVVSPKKKAARKSEPAAKSGGKKRETKQGSKSKSISPSAKSKSKSKSPSPTKGGEVKKKKKKSSTTTATSFVKPSTPSSPPKGTTKDKKEVGPRPSTSSSAAGGSSSSATTTTQQGTHSCRFKQEVIMPQTRVKVIMKSSPDIDQVGQDVLFAVSKATELFIDHLTNLTHGQAQKGKTVEYNHLSEMIRKQTNMEFLRDIIPTKMLARDALREMAKQNALALKELLGPD